VEETYRPYALRVMAEYTNEDPVWDSDADHVGPVVLDTLGVSADPIQRLRAWNRSFGDIALTDFEFPSAEAETSWQQEGLRLAYELQNELPDIDISYSHDADSRPMRQRRGP
jgi:hypothetical protein